MKWVKGEAYHCTACATASILDIELKDIFNIVGHDGSAVYRGVRRGHSFDEMQDVAWYYGKSFALINASPKTKAFDIYTDPGIRLDRYFSKPGIFLLGVNGYLHAVAHNGNGLVIDPATGPTDVDYVVGKAVFGYYMLTTLEQGPL